MHLGQFKLSLGAHAGGESRVANDISKRLSKLRVSNMRPGMIWTLVLQEMGREIPLCLVFSKDLPLRVVAYDPDVDEAPQVELLGSKH